MNNHDADTWMSLDDEEREERGRRYLEYREQEATRLHGPPEERRRKNLEHVRNLVAKYSEPVVRAILRVLCDSEHTSKRVFAELIRRGDPEHGDLVEIMPRYDLGGPRIDIDQPAGPGGWFNVKVSGGWDIAGESWEGVLWKDETGWQVQQNSYGVS